MGEGTVLALFTITIFLGALLLFLVQPMAAKGLLPLLGGSPSVWNTCMVFFQAALLAGYAYAHGLLRVRRTGVGVAVHGLVLLGAAATLPIAAASGQPGGSPVAWLLGALAAGVGASFFALSATGPLVQGWFGRLGHRDSGDPYFLYAASNAGSMLALLAYPLLVEPWLNLRGQGWVWSAGYVMFAGAMIACGVWAARRGRGPVDVRGTDFGSDQPASAARAGARLWGERGRWVALAFVPSSLMLGVTQYISTDLAPVPLLWIAPLAIYLLSFILVFGRRRVVPAWVWSWGLGILAIALGVAFLRGARQPLGLIIGLHLATLLAGSMVCHGRLAADRPAPSRLTEFYLLVALGGVLGGIFNALLAPVAFSWIAEYPLALAMACLFRVPRPARVQRVEAPKPGAQRKKRGAPAEQPSRRRAGRAAGPAESAGDEEPAPRPAFWRLAWEGRSPAAARVLDLLWPLWVPVLFLWIHRVLPKVLVGAANRFGLGFTAGRARFLGDDLPMILGIGVPALLCYLFSGRNLRLAAGLAALFASGHYLGPRFSELLHRERTFFGVYRVERYWVAADESRAGEPVIDPATGAPLADPYHSLAHGSTKHGLQNMSPERRREPLIYYHRKSPIGQLIAAMGDDPRLERVGLVGLGTGALAAYGAPGRSFSFFEIDPAVVRIARDPALFTYLADSAAAIEIEIGDGRLTLAREPDGKFGLLVLDAFSSDAIPVHLITVEAIRLYLSKLAPGGVLAFHISNRHLNLSPVLAAAAEGLGLTGLRQIDLALEDEADEGRVSSTWVMLARERAALRPIARDGRWEPLRGRAGFRAWTDDYSNIWSIMEWD